MGWKACAAGDSAWNRSRGSYQVLLFQLGPESRRDAHRHPRRVLPHLLGIDRTGHDGRYARMRQRKLQRGRYQIDAISAADGLKTADAFHDRRWCWLIIVSRAR